MRSMNPTRALFLGALIGLSVAVLPACPGPTTITRCNSSNCAGCCDDTGSCFKGTSAEACGKDGTSCSVCASGQTCVRNDLTSDFGGVCSSSGVGGGGGTTGGGTATGGGTGTGGGSATGGGSGGNDGGTCGPTNCANGCCSATGVCITNTTPSRCGTGGNACSSCTMGNTCVSGACTPCAGCIDIQTGQCKTGADNTACGKMGGFCQACDQNAGQTCQNGTCFGGTTCNASTCAGCCDGNNCKLPNQFTTAQCGQGAPGAACTTCLNGATCDALDAGMCVGGNMGTGGGGGGFPGLDGGFPDLCGLIGAPCMSGECCDVDAIIGIIPTCYAVGEMCGSAGSCQSSGVCQ